MAGRNTKKNQTRKSNKRPSVKSNKKRRRTMKGGVSFNSPMNFQDIPKTDYYPLNSYANDPSVQPYLVDSRQLGGKKTRHNQKRNQKKIKGGSTFLTTDPILGGNTLANNNLLSMNQIPGYSGANNISNVLNGGTVSNSGPSLTYSYVNNAMV